MPMKLPVTDLEIVKQVKAGKICAEIAHDFNISISTVHYRIKRYQKNNQTIVSTMGQNKKKISEEWIKENIIIPRQQGYTLQEIATFLNISRQRVWQLEQKYLYCVFPYAALSPTSTIKENRVKTEV